MSSIVIDHLQEQLRQPKKIGIAFVYCVYDRVGHTASDLLANLLKQLALQTVAPLEDITTCHERHSKLGTRPALKEISELLSLQVQRFDEVFIIIDALDECPEADRNRTTFIGEVRGLLPKVRLMVTSRDIPSIEKTFHSDRQLRIRATDQDVKLFVESQIDQEAELSDLLEDHDDVRSMITTTVVEKSRGMSVSSETSTDSGSPDDRFLIAVLHMDSLAKEDNLRDLKEALHRLPEDLYKTYDDALIRINRQDSRRLDRANKVLMLINCAKRPLKLNEMRQALSVRREDKFLDPEALPKAEALISTCCGLVVVEEESQIVRLVHYTTEEYFERKQHHFRSPEAHQYFCDQLITYLGFTNIAGLVVEDQIARMEMEDERRKRLTRYPLFKLSSEKKEPDLVIYGADNWGYHARQAFARHEDRPTDKSRDLEQQIDLYLRKSPNVGFAIRLLCYLEERRDSFFRLDFLKYSKGSTSLHTAATHGIYPLVEKYLSNGADVNAADAQGRTALHSASKYGHVDIVQLLLDHGAAIDIQDRFGANALFHVVCINRLPVARLLLQNGSDPCSSTVEDYSTLKLAAARGYQTMLELLIEYGTHSVDMSRFLGDALIEAVRYGQEGVVDLLAGNAEALNISGQDLIRATGKAAWWNSFRRTGGTLRILLDAGVDVNQKIREAGVDVNRKIRGHGTHSPLIHVIVFRGASDALALVLEKGADVDALNTEGDTALVSLAKEMWDGWSDVPIARQLLEAGANIKATDGEFNRTSLEWAVLRGSRDLVRLLLEWESPRSALGARARAGSDGTVDYNNYHRYEVAEEIAESDGAVIGEEDAAAFSEESVGAVIGEEDAAAFSEESVEDWEHRRSPAASTRERLDNDFLLLHGFPHPFIGGKYHLPSSHHDFNDDRSSDAWESR
ncbi:MAG: hypothetical protein Q9193_004234 [Seirophora villosa]